jgi:hypothetical protein
MFEPAMQVVTTWAANWMANRATRWPMQSPRQWPTLWLMQPGPSQPGEPELPDPGPQAPPGVLSDAASTFLSWMKWGGLVGAIGALIAAGIMMAIGRRNRNNMAVEGAMSLPWVVGGLALIFGASSLVGFLGDGQ